MRQSDFFIKPKRPWNVDRLIGPKVPPSDGELALIMAVAHGHGGVFGYE